VRDRRADPSEAPDSDPLGLGNRVASITIGEDGTMTIGGGDGPDGLAAPAIHTRRRGTRADFDQNLALDDRVDLFGLGHDLAEQVAADQRSRAEALEMQADGIGLLGLKIEKDGHGSGGGNVSRLGHPLLLTAVVEGQAAMAGELMPARGPCKVEEPADGGEAEDDLARSFAHDMNRFLTKTAPEYYPDFDRGIWGLNFRGNLFKRIYKHPLKRRPAGDCISVEDLIVSEDASDLDTAIRVTQRSEMTHGQVRRMMRWGGWRDVDMAQPMLNRDAVQRRQDETLGTSPFLTRPSDIPRTMLQTTTDLCMDDYDYEERDAPGDVPISYMVTWDETTHQVLDIRRKWRFGDEYFERKPEYVHYGMIPSDLGFMHLGFVHLLGNQTKALRAGWNILFDAGMYGNIQAWIKAKGVRGTNEIRPKPGDVVELDLGPFDDIEKAIKALPTKDPSQVFIALNELIAKESERVTSAVKLPTGEGRADVPVGTMMALVEQATKIATSVQGRAYRSLTRELTLFRDLFAEDPESLKALNRNPAYQARTREEVMDQELVPQADPNVPSQLHRVMLATAMVTVAGQNPDIYDRAKVHIRAWKQVGVNDAAEFIHDPAPQPGGAPGPAPPDPLIGQARMLEAKTKAQKAQQDVVTDQRRAANELMQANTQQQEMQSDAQNQAADRAQQLAIERMRLEVEKQRVGTEQVRAQMENERAREQASIQHQGQQMQHERETQGMAMEHQRDQQGLAVEQQGQALQHQQHQEGLAHEAQQGEAERQSTAVEGAQQRAHQATEGAEQRKQAAVQSKGELGVKKMAARKRPAPRKG
jgi:hypothetical protein